jgi:long-chain acyl-CoA synthetase
VRLIPSPSADEPGVGEVCVRGPQVMRGYHRDPDATFRVLDPFGWLRTGDLGEWTAAGLKVRGRADGVFKLENGEKVATGDVESRVLAATPLIEQALVIGSGQPTVSALLWLSLPAVRNWAEAQGLELPEGDAVALFPELRLAIAEALRAANLLAPAYHERVRRAALLAQPPTLEHGELTPTLKLVRTAVLEHHAPLVSALLGRAADPRILEIDRRAEG